MSGANSGRSCVDKGFCYILFKILSTQRSRHLLAMRAEVGSDEYLEHLGIQLGIDLEQYLPNYMKKNGTEEERHQHAVGLVKTFLNLGGSPNAVDYHRWPLLTIAVVRNCAPLVEMLLDKGADINFKHRNHYGVPDALYAFVVGGGQDLKVLDMILRAGVGLDGCFLRGTAEDLLGSGECLIKDHQIVKILQRIDHERSRRDTLDKVYEFMKVAKPRSQNIDDSVWRQDMAKMVAKEVLQIMNYR